MINDQEIKRIYDSFTIKDLSFETFRKEVRNITNPASAAAELANMRKAAADSKIVGHIDI